MTRKIHDWFILSRATEIRISHNQLWDCLLHIKQKRILEFLRNISLISHLAISKNDRQFLYFIVFVSVAQKGVLLTFLWPNTETYEWKFTKMRNLPLILYKVPSTVLRDVWLSLLALRLYPLPFVCASKQRSGPGENAWIKGKKENSLLPYLWRFFSRSMCEKIKCLIKPQFWWILLCSSFTGLQ